jgi:hypothetical protein
MNNTDSTSSNNERSRRRPSSTSSRFGNSRFGDRSNYSRGRSNYSDNRGSNLPPRKSITEEVKELLETLKLDILDKIEQMFKTYSVK